MLCQTIATVATLGLLGAASAIVPPALPWTMQHRVSRLLKGSEYTPPTVETLGLVVGKSEYTTYKDKDTAMVGRCRAPGFVSDGEEGMDDYIKINSIDECHAICGWVSQQQKTWKAKYPDPATAEYAADERYALFRSYNGTNKCDCFAGCFCTQNEGNFEKQGSEEEWVGIFPAGEAPPPYSCKVWSDGWITGMISQVPENWSKMKVELQQQEHLEKTGLNQEANTEISSFFESAIKKPVDQWSLWLVDPAPWVEASDLKGGTCLSDCFNSRPDFAMQFVKNHPGLYQTAILGHPVSSHLPEVRQFCQDCVREGGVGDSCRIIPFCMVHERKCTKHWGPSSQAPAYHLIELCREVAQVDLERTLTKFQWAGDFAMKWEVVSQMALALTANGWNVDVKMEDVNSLSSLSQAIAHGGIVAVNLTGDVTVLGGPLRVPAHSILMIVGKAPGSSFEGFQLITESISKRDSTDEAAVQRYPVLDAVNTGRIFVADEGSALIIAGLTLRGAVGSAVCARQNSNIQIMGSILEDNRASFGIDTSIPGCPAEVGGAIYCGGCESLSLTGSHFYRNSAGAGGAVFANGYGRSHIENCTFSGNWASAGGGLYLQGAGSKLTSGRCLHVEFGECVKWEKSGDVELDGSTSLASCQFLDGRLEEPSGMQAHSIRNEDALLEGVVDGLQLTGGQACLGCLPTLFPHGGCFAAVGVTSMIINQTEFRNCKALPPSSSVASQPSFPFRMGGGLFVHGGAATLENLVVAGNAASMGGGLCFQKANANLRQSTVTGNMATTGDGGGLFASEGQISLANMTVTENKANNAGGGFVLQGMKTVMEETNITDNLAPNGGGALIVGGRAELVRIRFARNMHPNSLKTTEYERKKNMIQNIKAMWMFSNWTGSHQEIGDPDVRADKGATILAKGVHFDWTLEAIKELVWPWFDVNGDDRMTRDELYKIFEETDELPLSVSWHRDLDGVGWENGFDNILGASWFYKPRQAIADSFFIPWNWAPNGGHFRVGLMNGATWTSHSLCPEGTAEPYPQKVVPFHVDLGDASRTTAWMNPVNSYVQSAAECLECPPGTYNSKFGAVADNSEGEGACQPCPAGTANAKTGATSSYACTSCQSGQYSFKTGMSECLSCPQDTVKGSPGQRSCPCAQGFVLQFCDAACRDTMSSSHGLACPEGWIFEQGSCYLKLSGNKAKNYDEAVNVCKGFQGHFPIIDSPEKNQLIWDLIGGRLQEMSSEKSSALTGLRDPGGNESKWAWSDGTCVAKGPPKDNSEHGSKCTQDYTNWYMAEGCTKWPIPHAPQGDERLVLMNEGGDWRAIRKSELENEFWIDWILCERPPGRCLPCSDPLATTVTEGSASLDDCVCREGTFLRPGLGCNRCKEGLECPGMSQEAPLQVEGFMVDVVDADTREYSVYQCLNPARCPGGPVGKCNGGASGLMCLECPMEPTRHYWNDRRSQCVDCSESGSTTWVMPVVFLGVMLGMISVFKSSLPKDGRENLTAALEVAVSLGLFLVMAQTASVFGRLLIPWGSPLDQILEICSFLTLDLSILQLDCVVGFEYVDRFILGSMLPMIGIVCYVLVGALVLKLGWVLDAKPRVTNSIGLITQALFIGLLLHGIEPFLVFQHPNGEKSMTSAPEVLQGSETHSQLVIFGVVHVAIYGVGFLSLCLFACYQIHLRASSGEARGVNQILWYRFLYFKFIPQRYYWGVVHIVRAGLIALTPVIFESPHQQIVLLTMTLTTFLALQCLFWPYRSNLHNVLDVAVHGAMLSLCTGAAFFLPTQGHLHVSIVNMILISLGLCGAVFASVLMIPVVNAIHRRFFQTKEQRELEKQKLLARERTFAAELQKTKEDELFGCEELQVDIEKIISIKPKLEAHRLVRVLSSTDPKGVDDIEILLPLAHSGAQAAADGLAVYEKKLRWRAQEFFEKCGQSLEKKQKLEMRHYTHGFKSPIAWTAREAKEVKQLIDYVQWFMSSYSSALLSDTKSLHVLKIYKLQMQAKFRGVYQACVHDILQQEPGFHAAVGLGTFLEKQVVAETMRPAPAVPEDTAEMYMRAVITEELLMSYVSNLASATRGRTPKTGATKHLWRVTEKQCLSVIKENSAVWDISRTLVEYDSMQSLAQGLEHLQKDHSRGKIQILRVKERFSQPTSGGWSDILVNICFLSEDPQVQALPCEIQFVHSQLMLIRAKMGAHVDYSKFRVAQEIIELHEGTEFADKPVVPPVPVQFALKPQSSNSGGGNADQPGGAADWSGMRAGSKCVPSPPASQPPALDSNSNTYSAVVPGVPGQIH